MQCTKKSYEKKSASIILICKNLTYHDWCHFAREAQDVTHKLKLWARLCNQTPTFDSSFCFVFVFFNYLTLINFICFMVHFYIHQFQVHLKMHLYYSPVRPWLSQMDISTDASSSLTQHCFWLLYSSDSSILLTLTPS